METLDAKEIVRSDRQLSYKIESGWERKPFWHCKLGLGEEKQANHIHTTLDAGEAPSIFRGKSSGLYFHCKGNIWPVGARKGNIVLTTWKDDIPFETIITPNEAISLLN